jgi:hypothetical protein
VEGTWVWFVVEIPGLFRLGREAVKNYPILCMQVLKNKAWNFERVNFRPRSAGSGKCPGVLARRLSTAQTPHCTPFGWEEYFYFENGSEAFHDAFTELLSEPKAPAHRYTPLAHSVCPFHGFPNKN